MRRSSSVSLLLLFLLLLAVAPARAAEVSVEGKRVTITSTCDYRPAAERCRDVLDAAVSVYEAKLPYKLPEGAKLVLHLFAKHDEYAAAVTAAGAGAFVSNEAATANSNKESYLLIQPRCDAAYLEIVGGLPELTCYLACHEGVHQFVRRAGAPHCETWPDWYAEGMADWLAEVCLRERRGAGPLVCADDKAEIVRAELAKEGMLALEKVLLPDVAAAAGDVGRNAAYAHCVSLYGFLAGDGERSKKLHDAVRRMGGPPRGEAAEMRRASGESVKAILREVFGPLDDLERRWREHAGKERRRWFEHIRSSQASEGEVVCAAFPGSTAILIASEPPGGAALSIACELEIVDVEAKQAEIYLGYEGSKQEPRFLKLAFGAEGFVTLLAFAGGEWRADLKVNVDVEKATFACGERVPVEVTVKDGKIRVFVRGKKRFETAVPESFDALHGRWGLGSRGTARFRKIAVDGKE